MVEISSTGATGTFSFNELSSETYTVIPSKTGYIFSPTASVVTLEGTLSIQNFTSVPAVYGVKEVLITGLGNDESIGCSIDSQDRIYVSNQSVNNSYLRRYSPSNFSTYEVELTSAGGENFNGPHFIDLDSDGNIYFADESNSNIKSFTSDWVYIRTYDGNGAFNSTMGVALGSDGYLYVTENNTNVRKIVVSTGAIDTTWSSASGSLRDIAVDRNNEYVYICDMNDNIVEKYTTDGTFAGNISGYDGDFDFPDGIAVDYDGYIYVGDIGGGRIQKFDSEGNWICTITNLSTPRGIAIDTNGTVYVLEGGNGQVSRFNVGP